MRTRTTLLILLAITGLTLTSCKKDKEAPTIIVSEPIEHTHFTAGTSFQLSATFSDDQDLASFHTHTADAQGNHVLEFDWEEVGTISGKSHTLTSTVNIPAGINNVYYLHFEVEDAEGKTTEELIEIHVDP